MQRTFHSCLIIGFDDDRKIFSCCVRLLAAQLNTTHARSFLSWFVFLRVFLQHQISWECSSSSSCRGTCPCWCAATPWRWSALKILHSLSCMCSVAPVQKDDTQHQTFLYHLRIQSSILNEMFFEWLLGSECVPLSIVKQMY